MDLDEINRDWDETHDEWEVIEHVPGRRYGISRYGDWGMDGEGNKFVGPIVHRTDDHRLKSELNVELTYDEAKTVEKLRRNYVGGITFCTCMTRKRGSV